MGVVVWLPRKVDVIWLFLTDCLSDLFRLKLRISFIIVIAVGCRVVGRIAACSETVNMLVVGQMYHPLSSSRCSPTQRMLHSTQTQCAFHTRFPHSKKLTPHTRLVVHCTVHASSSSTAVDAPTFEQYLLSTHQDTLQVCAQPINTHISQ